MKGFKSTSTNPYTYTQSGVWKKGQYTFQAVVISDSGYAIAFQKPDLSWDVIDLSWQVQAGQYCSVQESGFTLEYDAVAFRLIANDVTGEVIVLLPMLEQGGNPSTPIAHEEDLRGMDGDNHEFIFTRNNTGIAPDAPLSTQEDDLEPEDWTDNPQGVTKELPFEFVSMREKKVGVWLDFSPPSLWAKWSEDGLAVYLRKQGHYETRWVGTEKVTDIVGGEMFGETELIKVTAVFHKGEEDVAPSESLSRGFQWYVNGVHLPAFDDQHYITLDSTYGDGFADIVKLSYMVNSLREEIEVEVMNISAGMDGIGEEFIFKANNSNTTPPVLPHPTDDGYQDDDYHGDWSDDPVSPTELNQYVWVAMRKKVGGVWGVFGTPSLWTWWVTDGGDAAYWELHSSAPLIYKDAEDASTSGVHTSIMLSGRYVEGATFQNGGYISVQPNGGAEDTPLISPREFTPPNNAGVDEYVIRLYDDASKTTLLDTLTVPIAFKGEKGVSAINITLSNEKDALPATEDGVVTDYNGSGTTIWVFEGATELSYGTGNGEYQVFATGSNISPDSTPTTNGNARVYGNASSMGEAKTAVITFTVSGKTFGGESFSFDKVQNFTKAERGDTGASAPLLYLSASSQVMRCNPDNTPQTGQTITINAKLQNIEGIALFSAIPYDSSGEELPPVTLWANINDPNEKTLRNLQWLSTFQKVVITATLGSLTDKVTIHRLADGATGENVIVGFLTNENITLQASNAGVVSSLTPANGEFWVYDGTTKVTSGITFSKVSQTGCTAAITSAGVYSVSAMSADNATVVFRAVYGGVTIDKVLTLSKSNAGADGITIIPNQQGHTYRADLNGAIIGSLADGMVELTITSGSTPITCSSATSGGTPTTNGTYRVTRTLGNGITTNQSVSGGKYRITPATLTVDEASVELEIKIMMGGVVTSYPLTLTYQKQFDGADGKSTEFIFKGSTSDTTAPTLPSTSQQDDWYGQGTSYVWNDDLIEPTKTLPYVWASQRKKVDGVWGAFTPPKVWLRYSDGITSTTIHYAKSSSGTTIPTTWSTSLPTPTKGMYLWTRTTTVYKISPTTVAYSISYWADDGYSPYIDETTNTWWVWDDTDGLYKNTGHSPVGSDGAIPYPAGYYDNTKRYRREAEYAPYVQYEGALYLLIKDTPSAGIATSNTTYWKAFNHWEAVFVDSLVAAFAKIGGAVFTGNTSEVASGIRGRMISEMGEDGTTTFVNYTGDGGSWQPNIMLDFRTGKAKFANADIVGHITATSGSIGGVNIENETLSVATPTTNGILSSADKAYIEQLKNLFEYDAGNDAIKALKTLYSVGGISALGLGESGGGSGGGGISMMQGWTIPTGAENFYAPANLVVPFYNDMQTRVANLEGGGGGTTPTQHTHVIGDITGLQSALDGKASSTHSHSWGQITGKPSTFAPSAHTLGSHSDVTITSIASGEILKWDGTKWINNTLVEAGISASSHSHSWSQITGKPSSFTPSTHTHTKSQITDFPTTWAWGNLTDVPSTFAPSSHSHSWSSITSKPSTFAPSAHILGSHSDVSITSIASGEILKWNGTAWINNTLAEAGISASTHSHSWSQITSKPSTFAPSAHTHTKSQITDFPTTWAWGDVTGKPSTATTHPTWAQVTGKPSTFTPSSHTHSNITITAGNGLSGGGALSQDRTLTLGTPSTLTNATTNSATASTHTHAITTTTVGLANTIVATDASGGVRGSIIRIGGNWTLELSGTELVFKYSGVIKQRMLSNGTILATGGITALATN